MSHNCLKIEYLEFKLFSSELKCANCGLDLLTVKTYCKVCKKELSDYTFCNICNFNKPEWLEPVIKEQLKEEVKVDWKKIMKGVIK